MCGRYTISADPKQLAERFDAALPAGAVESRYNAAPSQTLPTLLNEDDERVIQLLRWGLVPHWSKEPTTDYSMINARAETLEQKSTFKQALYKRRCLVLADGFYEWQKPADGGSKSKKIPMRFTLTTGEPFAFAGLWDVWRNDQGEILKTFTIITTSANDVVAPVHNRMPVILLPENEKHWLDNNAGPDVWRDMLRPYPTDLMKVYPVSTRVNSASVDDPSLIKPVEVS
jgi:putative SOS response-associated peptidase YedK